MRDVLQSGVAQAERSWDVLVTTYEVANMEVTALEKFAWRCDAHARPCNELLLLRYRGL